MESPVISLDVNSLSVRAGASSVTGKVRRINEDSYLCVPGAYVVADGMGGHNAGDVASQLTIGAVVDWLAEGMPDISSVPSVVMRANDAVRGRADEHGQQGMGSTLVGAFLARNAEEDSLVVVNVGDSRCYLVQGGSIEQLTKDHSLVQELVDAGSLLQEAAATHPDRNVVTRAIGIESMVAADFYVVPTLAAARLMLCSDGVSGELALDRIRDILTTVLDPALAAVALTDAVLEGRAADNATAVVVDVVRSDVEAMADDDLDITGPRVRPELVEVPADIDREPAEKTVTDVIATVPMGEVRARAESTGPTDVIDEVPGG